MDIFDQFAKFKTTIKKSIQESRPQSHLRSSILKQDAEVVSLRKKTLQHHHRSSTQICGKENLLNQNSQKKEFNQRFPILRSQFEDVVTLREIQQISDNIIDCPDHQFNNLSKQYVDELVKLSSIIMYRVKNSKFNQ